MNEEFLTGLGLDRETSDMILQKYDSERLEEGILKELGNAGVADVVAARTMLDCEGLNMDNLSQRVKTLKEEHPALFKTAIPRIVSSAEIKSTLEKKDFDRMTYRERLELFKKNPDKYKKLVE